MAFTKTIREIARSMTKIFTLRVVPWIALAASQLRVQTINSDPGVGVV